MEFKHKIIHAGTENKPLYLKNKIKISNTIALTTAFAVAFPFIVISSIFYQSLAFLPIISIPIVLFGIWLNYINMHVLGRVIISLSPFLLSIIYGAMLMKGGEKPIISFMLVSFSFAFIPAITFDLIKEKFLFYFLIVFSFMGIVFFDQLNSLIEMQIDDSLMRDGWLSYLILVFSFFAGFGNILTLVIMSNDAEKEIDVFTKETKMQNANLQKSEEELQNKLSELAKRQEKDEQLNWVNEGLANFASLLRENNDDLEKLSSDIIISLVKYVGANQGGIFIINDNSKNPKMELQASYAYNRKKYAEKEFQMGEGLIGQCWQEKEKIFLTEIPQSYLQITSGLGTANPTCILILPLITNDEIYGIIEIASFKIFDEFQLGFIEKVASSIASTMSSVKINIHTSSLLEESQQMSEELQAQEEELRQNAEEMQATQEEMERAQKELIKQEASLRAIINNSEDSIFAINTEYEITVVNTKLKNKYKKINIDLSVGENIINLIPEDKRSFWKERYDRALNGEKFETEDELSPGIFANVFHYPTHDDNNKINGVAVVSREINNNI